MGRSRERCTTRGKAEKIEPVLNNVSKEISFSSLKSKQKESIVAFVQGNDAFVSLPTSYGTL